MARPRSIGRTLDTSPAAFGEPQASNDVLDDMVALRRRIEVDGYLLIRGFLDGLGLVEARNEVVESLARRGLLDPRHAPLEVRAGPGADTRVESESHRFPSVRALMHGNRLSGFYQRLLGAPVRYYDHIWMRLLSPGAVTGPHCDIVYMGRGTADLYTAWVALGAVPREQGALMILEGSNRRRDIATDYCRMDIDRDHNWRRIRYRHGRLFRGGDYSRNPRAVQREFGLRWLTTDYGPGDLVVLTAHTMHGSLDNTSDRIRISADTRYQRASEPIDERWIGEHPIGHSGAT